MELDELIENIDIAEYISQFVDLKERNGELWGLSPFKNEKTPSFSVRPEEKNFYCFSTGIGGNVFTFVRYYFKCSPSEAIRRLRDYLGDNNSGNIVNRRLTATRVCRLYETKDEVEPNHHVFSNDCMEMYEKNDEALDVWIKEGISPDTLEKFQVKYDMVTNRLVYPIKNLRGEIVNIGGRTLDPSWKEKGYRKYTYFVKWGEKMDVIYGLYDNMDEIMAKREIILFEGCKSVFIANTWGIRNTGAILTSHLSPSQMGILARLGVRVVFALDKDVDIRKDHNIKSLRRYTEVEYLWDKDNLIDEKDAPVDKGKEVFAKLYQQRLRYR